MGRSVTSPPPLISPSSIHVPTSSHCAFIFPQGKIRRWFRKHYFNLLSKLREQKLPMSRSVCAWLPDCTRSYPRKKWYSYLPPSELRIYQSSFRHPNESWLFAYLNRHAQLAHPVSSQAHLLPKHVGITLRITEQLSQRKAIRMEWGQATGILMSLFLLDAHTPHIRSIVFANPSMLLCYLPADAAQTINECTQHSEFSLLLLLLLSSSSSSLASKHHHLYIIIIIIITNSVFYVQSDWL